MLTLIELAQLVPDAALLGDGTARITGVSIDSRSVAPGELFVALHGDRFDGHEFIEAALARGAAAVMVSRDVTLSRPVPVLRVSDTLVGLQTLATGWRRRFAVPVVAIVGSNGKTTTKEMLAAILVAAYGQDAVLATLGNLNNEIGVPLTLLRFTAAHRVAVVELGMNHPGETQLLARMAAPEFVLITNAQREHQEFMLSVEAVAQEHALALAALTEQGTAVIPADDRYASVWWQVAGRRRVVDFALRARAGGASPFAPTVHAMLAPPAVAHTSGFGLEFTLITPDGSALIGLQTVGLHNVRNATAAAAAAWAIGISVEDIARGLARFIPVKGRMQQRVEFSNGLLLDDTYNANPDSVIAAIDVLAACPPPRCLVLGDMGEVGDQGQQFHIEIGAYAQRQGIDAVYGLGDLAAHTCAAFGTGAQSFAAANLLIDALRAQTSGGAILVKGSRFMRMERIVDALIAAPHGAGQAVDGFAAMAHGQEGSIRDVA